MPGWYRRTPTACVLRTTSAVELRPSRSRLAIHGGAGLAGRSRAVATRSVPCIGRSWLGTMSSPCPSIETRKPRTWPERRRWMGDGAHALQRSRTPFDATGRLQRRDLNVPGRKSSRTGIDRPRARRRQAQAPVQRDHPGPGGIAEVRVGRFAANDGECRCALLVRAETIPR